MTISPVETGAEIAMLDLATSMRIEIDNIKRTMHINQGDMLETVARLAESRYHLEEVQKVKQEV